MNLYYFLLLFPFFSFTRDLIQQINKKIEDIDFMQEKITTIETFLNYALDHKPIKKLLDFLKTNKLFTKDIILKNEYSFQDLLLQINENSLIEYIKKNNISKNTIEKILNDAFGKNEEREITSFVKTLFIKIKTMQEQEIETKIEKEAKKIITDLEEREKKTKDLIKNDIKKQERSLEERIAARKKKKKEKEKEN